MAVRIAELARERLGETTALRIGRAPKRLLVYRTEAPFKGFKLSPIEILCDGQQFVAYHIHPDTGRPYEWPEELAGRASTSAGCRRSTRAQARAFAEEAYALLPDSLRPARLAGGDAHPARETAAGESARNAAGDRSGARVHPQRRSRLRQLDAHRHGAEGRARRRGRASVCRMVGAVGEERAGLHREGMGRLPSALRSAPAPSTITPWPTAGRQTRTSTLNGNVRMNGRHPARALLEKLSSPALQLPQKIAEVRPVEKALVPPCPVDIAGLDGVLKMLVDYMLATARRPQPVLAVGASLCALGALMGRKYRTESNLRSTSTSSASPIQAPARTTAARSSPSCSSKPVSATTSAATRSPRAPGC